MLSGRTPTKEERQWMQDIVQLGCICCIYEGDIDPFTCPPEYTAVHHIDGKTKEGAHLLTLPLCATHHQNGHNARHRCKADFEKEYGDEYSLLEWVKRLVKSGKDRGIL